MPKLRVISGKKLISAFESLGFIKVDQRGSHIKMQRLYSGITQTLVIPNHTSIAKGTLKEIYTQALLYFSEKDIRHIFYT
jgi:predicted RNA binding protein YcfA (HicA-like mRNA interferase family)